MDYPGRILELLSEGEAVLAVQRRLSVEPTGVYGSTTRRCVEAFQREHGIEATGCVGPQTWAALFPPASTERTAAGNAFALALRFTLKWEGGYVNNPHDPGGATNYGVTQATYDRYRASRREMGRASVRRISLAEVEAIYQQQYWLPAGCEGLHAALAVACFDTAVNFGLGGLRRLLRQVGPEGTDVERAERLCRARMARRERLIAHNSGLAVFRSGWLRRDAALLDYVRTLA